MPATAARRTHPLSKIALVAAAVALAAPVSMPAGAAVPPGIADPGQAGHAVKCQKLVSKGTAKYLATWSKVYAKCIGSLSACVQEHGSDPLCVGKAVTKCNAGIATLTDDTDKSAGTVLENLVTDFCGSLTVDNQVDDPAGMRFSNIADDCNFHFGVSSLANGASAIASCLFRETNCAAESMLLARMPRARQLLEDAGIASAHSTGASSCLTNVGGGGALIDAKAGKALLKCETGEAKAAVTFASKARGALAKCADAVFACAQTKPEQKCLDGATKTCAKQIAAVNVAETKLGDAVIRSCGKIPLADLTDPAAGDVDGLATACASVFVPSLATLADYATCVARQTRCQVEESVRFTAPRVDELFAAAEQPFASLFCTLP